MAVSAAAVVLCKHAGMDGLEDRECEFKDACEPHPEEVSLELWRRTQSLYLAGAQLAVAQADGDKAAVLREQRAFDRHSRYLGGFGKNRAPPDAVAFAEE